MQLKGNFSHLILSFPPNITDSQPSDTDLWMLVATKVSNYHALGAMLGLKFRRVEMFKKKHRGDPVLINMAILTTRIEEKTIKGPPPGSPSFELFVI